MLQLQLEALKRMMFEHRPPFVEAFERQLAAVESSNILREAGDFDSLPGTKREYSGWQELFENLRSMLGPYRNVAMQYSPNNIVFTVSLVDAGTVELVRSFDKNIVSSADLVSRFEATFTDE